MNGPSASRVAEVLLRQQDPANWSDEMWEAHEEAYEQDMQELRDAVIRSKGTESHLSMNESVDSSVHFLPIPLIPAEAWKFIEEAQQANERASSE